VIAATLLAILSHVQVVPSLSPDYDVTGAILYAEPNPSTRLSLSVVKGNEGPTIKASVRWKF
jgi:hypothetical protein